MKDKIIEKQKEINQSRKDLLDIFMNKERRHRYQGNLKAINELESELAALEAEQEKCPNCGETGSNCACMRNICIKCGNPVGNITFTICDDCWGKLPKDGAEDSQKPELTT